MFTVRDGGHSLFCFAWVVKSHLHMKQQRFNAILYAEFYYGSATNLDKNT